MNTLKDIGRHVGHDAGVLAAILAVVVLLFLFAQALASGIVYVGAMLF